MTVSKDLQDCAATKVRECFSICFGDRTDRFDVKIIFSDDMGMIGGTACFETSTITLNTQLFLENVDEYMMQIIPHEAAHLIADIKYPDQRHIVHGKAWKSIMHKLGCEPLIHHNLDTSSIAHTDTFRYSCSCDSRFFNLSKLLHKRINSGSVRICPICTTRIIYFPVGDTYS
jgi:SprT protein